MANAFPPAPYDAAFKQIAIYDAWYSGDMNALPEVAGSPTHLHRGVPHSGGIQGKVSAGIFGTPTSGQNQSTLHIPVAGDLAQLSADLLFAESPSIVLPGSRDTKDAEAQPERVTAQERLEKIVSSDAAHAELLRSGEYAAAHGGAYLAVVWDKAFQDHVWFRSYRMDCVIPSWRWGRLAGAIMWTEFVKGDDTYRLFENHEPGFIEYSLWKGVPGELGKTVPLDTLEETAHYLQLRNTPAADDTALDALLANHENEVKVATGVPYLTVEYFPNMLPNPMWDKQGNLANLGRSDFFNLEPLFARINALWSSLMLDFDNGMGRLTVPESYLRLKGPGQGAAFDYTRQVYSPVGGLVDDGKGGTITISQFEIRVEEHLGAIEALKREIAQAAGYSVSHFGIHEDGTKTATEVTDDRTDSERTRDKKALYVRPALARLARTALAIDALVFPGKGGALIEDLPAIEFAELSQVDPEKRARTIQMLDAARAISTRRRVEMAQPNLTDREADDEADLIRAENGIGAEQDPMVDPDAIPPTQLTKPDEE
jgi:hypothetical protein